MLCQYSGVSRIAVYIGLEKCEEKKRSSDNGEEKWKSGRERHGEGKKAK